MFKAKLISPTAACQGQDNGSSLPQVQAIHHRLEGVLQFFNNKTF